MDQTIKNDILYILAKVIFCLILLFIAFTIFFGMMRVDDQMMSPAMKAGDLVLYNRLEKDFVAKDCVVIDKQGIQVVRIIACPNDRVDITSQGLKVNGYLVQEKEINGITQPYTNQTTFPLRVPKDAYFVLCDTRPNGKDSRVYGCVTQKEIKGAVIGVLRRRGF